MEKVKVIGVSLLITVAGVLIALKIQEQMNKAKLVK
jgi:hypothetical protein